MTLLLIAILAVTAALIVVLVVSHRNNAASQPSADAQAAPVDRNVECCGAHEVCEAETLLAMRTDIVYYSDEELDAYRGTPPDGYSDAAIEEFRDVLLTLQMHEVTGWLKSLQLRGIEVPYPVRDEALMIVEEFRDIRMKHRAGQS